MTPKPNSRASPEKPAEPVLKLLGPVTRVVLIVLGTIALGLGILGIPLPIVPTTPFLLVAAACYLRSSERFVSWLVNHLRLRQSIRLYIKRKAVPLKVELISLAIAWAVLGGTALFMVEGIYVWVLLITLVAVKTIFMVRIKTLEAETG